MFSTLRNRFGIPGVISVIALVFAMFGGAYAASNSSDGGKATASAKAKKGPRGPKGATGPAGPAGPVGPAGPAGAKGDAGAAGATGATGPAGPAGPKGATGATGPAGAAGKDGETGFTETLPPGKTETGVWAYSEYNLPPQGEVQIPISFPIPLAEGSEKAFFLSEGETSKQEGEGFEAGCTGSVEHPTAPGGTLCVYTAYEGLKNVVFALFNFNEKVFSFQPSGTVMRFFNPESGKGAPGSISVNGSWAVTAPTP
jgi:hypothetical protein